MPDDTTTESTSPGQEAQTPQKIKLKVAGAEKELPLEDVVKMAEKAGGADESFRRASELKKEGETGIQIRDLYHKMRDGTATEDDVSKYCDLLEVDDETRDIMMGKEDGAGDKEPEKEGEEKKGGKKGKSKENEEGIPRKPLSLGDLPKDVVDMVRAAQGLVEETNQKKFEEGLQKALDEGKDVKVILDSLPKGGRDKIKQALFDRCKREAELRLRRGAKYRPELLQEVVAYEVKQLKDFGTLIAGSGHPAMGVGEGGESQSWPGSVQDKPIERKPVSDPDYADNFASRLLKKIRGPRK